MIQPKTETSGYRFGDFFIDAQNRQLWRADRVVSLNSKYFDVLLLLVSNTGQLVEKRRIFEEVWDSVFVTDAALTQCIKDIRKQLGDDAANPRFIKTIPKHGYMFIGDAVGQPVDQPIAPPVDAPVSERPYKFLDYYTEADADLFFGRDSEIETICSQILARRSFILHGRSGVGKSSILRAGVLPRLKSRGHSVHVLRSFTDPAHQVLESLRGKSPSDMVIFIFDQFEEFFSLLPSETREQFIRTIERLNESEPATLRFVFALREDFLAEMSQLKPALPEIFHHEYRLNRLSREQAARAITEPARRVGSTWEPDLVDRLLDDLDDHAVVDPPQLQIVCDNLYDSRDSAGRLTLAAYEEMGTASRILAGYLERVLARFNAADLSAARHMLTSLISVDGRRLVLRVDDLLSLFDGVEVQADRLLEELVAARVVRRRNQEGESWLELAHDFLTGEVSRWLTGDEVELRRARGVLDRAMENYRAHELTIDSDVLDLLLPFGEHLRLDGAEADLLMKSLLGRARLAPDWLIRTAPHAVDLIVEASRSPDPLARRRAVEAALVIKKEELKGLLCATALWDEDAGVRKSAGIALAEWFPDQVEAILSHSPEAARAGVVRRAVTLAMIRDHDKRMVRLSKLPLFVSLLVMAGLAWVRLRRDWHEIVREGLGGTLGGASAGLVGGMLLGAGLAASRQSDVVDAVSLSLVLLSLGAVVGAAAGFGVSFGLSAALRITYRHSRWWSVVGGGTGGAAVGAVANLLGVDTLKALFGQKPVGMTGAFEGLVIGSAVSLGAVLIDRLVASARPWQKILGAGLCGLVAGVLLAAAGGSLFTASLEILSRSFTDSQLRMDGLASMFGEVQFGRTTKLFLGAIEGLVFGCGVTGGINALTRQGPGNVNREP